jgi:hypothetical protein
MIGEERLRNALLEMQEYQVSLYPTPTEKDSEIPLGFRIKMNRLIERHDHPVWYQIKEVAVIVILLMGISAGLILGFNEKVRAEVFGWIMERFSDNEFQYQNHAHGGDISISDYSLVGNTPSGYKLLKQHGDENKRTEIFVNESGERLSFVVISPKYDGTVHVFSDEDRVGDPVYIDDLRADVYISTESGEANIITWQHENGIRFIIQGFLDKEQLIDLAAQMGNK